MRPLFRKENGQVTVLIIYMFPIFILFVGWSLDIGRILAAKGELYKACDIAAHEVAKEVNNDIANSGGQTYLLPERQTSAAWWVQQNISGLCGGTLTGVMISGDKSVNPRVITVEATADIPMLFIQMIGIRHTTIKCTGKGRTRGFSW